MIRPSLLGLLLLATATPAMAQEDLSPAHAEKRLRACLVAGSSAAPRSGLSAAIPSVRAFCTPQINRVRDDRVADATAGLTGPAARRAENGAVRALNNEIAYAIANFTGLTL